MRLFIYLLLFVIHKLFFVIHRLLLVCQNFNRLWNDIILQLHNILIGILISCWYLLMNMIALFDRCKFDRNIFLKIFTLADLLKVLRVFLWWLVLLFKLLTLLGIRWIYLLALLAWLLFIFTNRILLMVWFVFTYFFILLKIIE